MATGEEIRKFWAQTCAALSKVDMDAKVEPVESSDPFVMEGGIKTRTASCVIMSSFEDRRIRAWYTVPSGHPPARGWPAILEVPGYGGILPLPIHLVQYGYATLTLYPRGQGESLKEWQIEHGTRVVYNVTDRERYYYRGAYMDCVRGVDFLCSRPEIDTSRIGVWGFSQGGGLSLATAALDRRISAAVAGVPWLCNFPVAAEVTSAPYVELHDYLAQHPEQRDQAMATLAYFDQLNLAEEITCPTLIASAIIDEVHPLRTVLPVFEKIRSLKSIVVYPDLEHEAVADHLRWVHARWCAGLPDAEAASAAYAGQGAGHRGRRPRPWRYHAVRYRIVADTRRTRRSRRGRPAKTDPPPLESGYRLVGEVEALAKAEEDKGWTGLATTVSAEGCADVEILQAYQDPTTTVEPWVRWLKNPAAITPVWLEKPERIAALARLTVLGLLVSRVIQRQVRLYLRTHDQQIPGNKGLTATPTAAVVLALFAQVALVQLWIDEQVVAQLAGVQPHHRLVCDALGLDSAWYVCSALSPKKP